MTSRPSRARRQPPIPDLAALAKEIATLKRRVAALEKRAPGLTPAQEDWLVDKAMARSCRAICDGFRQGSEDPEPVEWPELPPRPQ